MLLKNFFDILPQREGDRIDYPTEVKGDYVDIGHPHSHTPIMPSASKQSAVMYDI